MELLKSRRTKGDFYLSCPCGKRLEDHRLGRQRYCLTCHADNMRRFRAKQKLEIFLLKEELKRLKNDTGAGK